MNSSSTIKFSTNSPMSRDLIIAILSKHSLKLLKVELPLISYLKNKKKKEFISLGNIVHIKFNLAQ